MCDTSLHYYSIQSNTNFRFPRFMLFNFLRTLILGVPCRGFGNNNNTNYVVNDAFTEVCPYFNTLNYSGK